MGSSKTIIYDGSFNGFLTLIFKAFDHRWFITDIQKQGYGSNELFTNIAYIKTDVALAKKVWHGINQRNHTAIKRIYYAFLSEREHVELNLYHYICYLMGKVDPEVNIIEVMDFLNPIAQKVEKEKRRMEAFAQFQLTKASGEVAHIKPKYNVLPLLSKYLRQSNKGKEWEIFDDKRKYGVRYSAVGLELTSNKTEVLAAV
ncbi:DUF4130 domain-containing protein [Flagellimonas myxillae]|uniref:DUF4130 domain-containing protein n=1 Tax=Flagellimonas myxillae TaxID=2942214 RepID=UPI00201F1D1B|nr:DUF4130 domain-containing protein [Muricauda myxillae]MCL6265825.1 DUF4130 domain-containing protein [Muricauda myxillae]